VINRRFLRDKDNNTNQNTTTGRFVQRSMLQAQGSPSQHPISRRLHLFSEHLLSQKLILGSCFFSSGSKCGPGPFGFVLIMYTITNTLNYLSTGKKYCKKLPEPV
jgi:hypothetical protein